MLKFNVIGLIVVISATSVLPLNPILAGQDLADLLTVAESSDFKSTSTSSQVDDFIDSCANAASHVSAFEFGKTVEGRPMKGVAVANSPYELGDRDDRVVALIIGNIHSGECAGKEALLMMVRELAQKPNSRWLEKMVILFVPNYNADANDRMGLNNRPGQIGPVNGMGRRENAQDLDLNRDFVKLESPEARHLVKLIDTVDPHLFIDCHTTNGSKHRYALTYDIPHNPAAPVQIRNFLRNAMMPAITKKLSDAGTETFYYGNFNREHTVWRTFGHQPRYSTEYVGLRGRLAILSEAYSYITYRERIFATKDFVSACLDFVLENEERVRGLLQQTADDTVRVADQQPSKISISLSARAEKFDQKFTLKGFKDDQPFDYQCDFIGKYVPVKSVSLPRAYLIPLRLTRVIDRLLMHGIKVEQTTAKAEAVVTIDTIKELSRNRRPFQKHRMRQATVQRESKSVQIPKGTYVVKTAQPLARLAAYLLEAESDDGFLFWNFLDSEISNNVPYPITRIDQVLDLPTEPVKSVPSLGSVRLDDIGGEDSLLATEPPPRWADGDRIRVQTQGVNALLDAPSLSFAQLLRPVFSNERLTEILQQSGLDADQINTIASVTPAESPDRNWLIFDTPSVDVVINSETATATVISGEAELFNFSPDYQKIAYVNNAGLNVLDLQTMDNRLIQAQDPATMLIGKFDWVYQEELYGRGNFKAYWFSPDSNSIAFLQLDESPVAKFTISDHVPVLGSDEFLAYPKAGNPNPVVSVGMAKLTTGSSDDTIHWVDLNSYADQQPLVSNVSWRPDSSQLVIQVQNREQTYLDFIAVDANQSEPTVLFRDQTSAWIRSPGEPKWLKDGTFVWLSPRSGYQHLYHYNADGSLNRQLTDGLWEVRTISAFDQDQAIIFFTAAKESAVSMDAYRLEIASGKMSRITEGAGTHAVTFNDDATMFIDSFSTTTTPTEYRLYRADGTYLRTLQSSSDDRLKYAGVSKPEFLTLQTRNGQPLDAMVIRPPNFDPSKKYPVLIHAYAGPRSPVVRDRFSGSWGLWHQALAQQGYVIWKCDNQSASYRSSKHAWPVHRNLGENELADIEFGVDWLKRQPWVDDTRIGLWGWSYGGYITSYALTHSDSFKIGIAGAPVTQWQNYDTIYTERYMGLPATNAKGYQDSSVVAAAENLSGKLLLIHGSIDDNVHLNNSMQLMLALQESGKPFELMIYPKNRHAIRRPKQAEHLRKLMFDFVVDNL